MADVSVKMGVSGISQFRQGLKQAQDSVKTIDAALKKNEAQFKATGNAQDYMGKKTDLLKQKLTSQKTAAANASQALAQMVRDGVDPASAGYQKLARTMLEADAAAIETETQLNSLGTASTDAAKQTDNLESSLQGLNKKVSLDQVISGLNSITSGLEKAAKKAVEVGKSIWDNIMDSAAYADDTATLASRMGLTTEEVQQMQYVANRFEAPVETIAKSWKKVKMSMSSDSDEIMADFKRLGLAVEQSVDTGFGKTTQTVMRYSDYKDVFWATGEAIMKIRNEEEQERIAQKLLGRSWDELIPLFTAGRKAYEDALGDAPTNSEEAINNAAELSDKVNELETAFKVLKTEVVGDIAPALTAAANTLENLINSITDYLKTDEGQEQMQRIADAIGKIFGNLSEINPEDVVGKFAGVMEKIQEAFTWIGDHWTDVETGLKAIGAAFGLIKIGTLALNLGKIVSGFKTLWAGAHNPLPQIPGTDDGAPTTTGGDSGTPKPTAKTTPKGKAPTAGPTNFVPFDVTGGAPSVLGASSLYATNPGLAAIGEGALGFGNLSLVGALGGTAAVAGIISVGTKVISDINDAAAKEREVEADAHRFSYIGGPMGDKQLILQDTIRRVLASTDDNGNTLNSADYQLKWLAYNLGGNMMDAFNYTNKSGDKRNKLVDMLQMEPKYAAVAALLMQRAGYVPNNDPRLSTEVESMFSAGLGAYNDLRANGSFDYAHGMLQITDFLSKSGMFDENGTFWIPELFEKNQQEQADAAKAMSDAAETMNTLPEKVAAAVSAAPIRVELGFGFAPKANGIWSVPFDGYSAILHKGERVVPAREVSSSRNYSSNLYVESMIMNNGTDAEGLAAAMAAAQRRTMSGYGS